jgi:hypothetical protein
MIADDFGAFRAIFRYLCLAVGAETDDARETLFFKQLDDVPLEMVRAAAGVLAKTHHRMPTVAHWRDACDVAQAEQKALPPAEVLDRRVVCEACEDTGWIEPAHGLACPGDARCGLSACHRVRQAHTYTGACGCRRTNPIYQFRHPITRKYGSEDRKR